MKTKSTIYRRQERGGWPIARQIKTEALSGTEHSSRRNTQPAPSLSHTETSLPSALLPSHPPTASHNALQKLIRENVLVWLDGIQAPSQRGCNRGSWGPNHNGSQTIGMMWYQIWVEHVENFLNEMLSVFFPQFGTVDCFSDKISHSFFKWLYFFHKHREILPHHFLFYCCRPLICQCDHSLPQWTAAFKLDSRWKGGFRHYYSICT